MLRTPTHVPTIHQLTQIHRSQYGADGSANKLRAQSRHKLYHEEQFYQQSSIRKDKTYATNAAVTTTTTTPTPITPTTNGLTTKALLFSTLRTNKKTTNKNVKSTNVANNTKTKPTTAAAAATTATVAVTPITKSAVILKGINLTVHKQTRTTTTTATASTSSVALTNAINSSSTSSNSININASNYNTNSTAPPTFATAFHTAFNVAASAPSPHSLNRSSMSPTSQTPTRSSLFDSCHRKIRLIGGGPVAFLGGLVAKARRKERDGDQNSTDTKLYLEESVLERKLPEADLKALVDLPAGLDYNEWLASHTLALFEHVNLVYGTVSEFCTPSGCADMTGPGNRTYLWFDEKGKKTRVAAPQYIDYVMTFTQKTVSDESIFPTKYANEFPVSFESIARKILRLQFHVIAHLYAAHFREIALLGLHTHLNLTFAHLTALHRRFNLIDEKETDVLRDLEVALRLTDDMNNTNNSSSNNHSHAQQQQQNRTSNNSSGSGDNNSIYEMGLNVAASATAVAPNSTAHATAANAQLSAAAQTSAATTASLANEANLPQGAASTLNGSLKGQPICTQPEYSRMGGTVGGGVGANNVYGVGVVGGGGGLMGGILGDFAGSDFSDTSRYCTSAVPASCAAATAVHSNNGAGALHLNFNSNFAHAHHHHHNHHLHHQHHQLHQQPPSSSTTSSSAAHNTTTA